ncbi:shikimate kinase [Ornithinibacillus sp. BX22]|uniref:Shikimate kinase n=1 Tax=Ornithinibacillus hominis TaxID=2763055 RepID=A0A923L642_9BACI|nr:shikimate kinase [Ornithinibacillus hominis]MBC5637197.1 shikimate kinase [Ornithinibacillus hominis]
MKQLYLIGFMGSGKTTVGRSIKEQYGIDYIDLDEAIEGRLHKRIVDIFKEEGEEAFRTYETETLKALKTTPIIATGGGIIERSENISYMKENGIIIYLKTSFDTIKLRLTRDQSRPLWKDEKQNKALFDKRNKIYEYSAGYIVHCDNRTTKEIIEEIVSLYRYKGILDSED